MHDSPRSPSGPLPPGADLFQRLAEAQDAALAEGRAVSGVDAVPAVRGRAARLVRRRLRVGAAVVALGAAAAGIALFTRTAPLSVQMGRVGQPGSPGAPVVADARSDLPLAFSDGSTITFRAGAKGRMQRLTAAGAELELERGRLQAHVVHAQSTLWLVHAGPYRVRVTGTRFSVDWVSPRLNVAVFEGSVVVDGGVLGAGVPLRAGQHLTVLDGVVRTERLAAGEVPTDAEAAVPNAGGAGVDPGPLRASSRAALADGTRAEAAPALAAGEPARAPAASNDRATGFTAPEAIDGDVADADVTTALGRGAGRGSAERPAAAAPATARDQDWLPAAERGDHAAALASAKRIGWTALCGRLDARRLLMLGDVARYAGAPAEARLAWKALVRRFPENRLAADAVFSLGRLAFEAERPREAATWFRSYVRRWPAGPLAAQASGRLMECAVKMEDDVAARGAARDYLERSPQGPHAPLANEILRDAPQRVSGVTTGRR